ncbi:conserved Plasmodium protein, unknown function [Plasmodium ovale wallikeri]|uniref:Uncharacterized protein n=1 Tax=Plasmodium ovale wallikeri TaxID=864142 RepID=A0A1A8ZZW2_PLAOA|nr:conserved Plasmodium protein, unknown function [Plasmodium ovale wallikeri]SBT49378.1 conserved Plasmodium protein, unknown function [Plasmodium ovale wallikeri]
MSPPHPLSILLFLFLKKAKAQLRRGKMVRSLYGKGRGNRKGRKNIFYGKMENVTSDNLHVGNPLRSQDGRISSPVEWENKSKRANKNGDSENSNLCEEDNKLIKSEKKNYMIFSSILRYKKYLVKKGNNYFDFNQTNLQLNEKEMLVHSSNFYHLFDLKSLFFPHIYINVNSHMNINISDYVNFLKMLPCMCMDEGGEKKDVSYNSKQEFVLEAIQKVEHMEV